ncbi:bifunctional nitrilase/nitrile hydratase NIT4-like [Bradysia coprophila]|uniref:bifunctional nitrilase/nitrile hydratase NIT4-like n=1 Tax=Bradysia coprophila TaxID=38358 RepID=UPI00187D79DF|nr:bifunctional nitrilase/nitrile hydratase NIT4-like [Bradysia coprophila]
MSEKGVTKVAVVQAASAIFNIEKTMEKVVKLAKDAADAGAKLVLFPEAFLSGYPHFLDFGKPGATNSKARDTFKRYFESSVDVPGPIVTQLANIAKENKIFMVVGAIERALSTLYCVTLFFNDEGQFLGKHRKLVPTTAERLVWGRGDGSTLPVFDWPMGKVGAVICWENYMPLVRMTMYSKGIQIYLAPNADDTDGWLHSMQHIALEGRCFVLACNQFIRKSDYPADLVGKVDCENDIVCRGGSVIVNPLGEILAGPNYTSEEILYATIDIGDVIKGKFDLDTVGHYSRPDIFALTVNEKEQANVTINRAQSEDSVQTSLKNINLSQ